MRDATAAFVLVAPVVLLALDLAIDRLVGQHATITGVVRSWAEESTWPEFVYVVGTVILYLHFFKGWPD